MKLTGFREQILDRNHAIKLFSCRYQLRKRPKRERFTDESSPMTAEPMLH
jgi:hypothetical protein